MSSEELKINAESSKEDVANFFAKEFKIKDDQKNKIISEDISGDVLYDLNDSDFKKLGVKLGPLKNIKKFLQDNKDKFGEKQINERITSNSKPEEVSTFFETCLNFRGELNNMDGKGLLTLDEEGMNNLGLNIGQKKRIVKYINYFKTLKVEVPEEIEIKLTRESSDDEVREYFKKKLNFSDKAIEELSLDGGTLFELTESEVDGVEGISEEEKEKLKNLIKELKGGSQEELTINEQSDIEAVSKFLKEKLQLSEKAIEALELDGKTIFSLEDSDIDGVEELTDEEKDKLKNCVKELKGKDKENQIQEPEIIVTKESDDDMVAKFLKTKLKFSENAIKALELDGKALFSLEDNDIDGAEELTEEEKNNLKNYLKTEREKNQNQNDIPSEEIPQNKEDSAQEKNPKEPASSKINEKKEDNKENPKEDSQSNQKEENQKEKEPKDNKKEVNIQLLEEKIVSENVDENKIEPQSKLKGKKKVKGKGKNGKNIDDPLSNDQFEIINKKEIQGIDYDEINSKELKKISLKNYEIKPLIQDAKYNIFLILPSLEKDIKNINLTPYSEEGYLYKKTYNIYKYYFINETNYINIYGEKVICLLIQIPLNKPIKKLGLYISVNTYHNKEDYINIDIKQGIENYFYIESINYDFKINDNRIFTEYLEYFFNLKNNAKESLQKSLLKALNNKIAEKLIRLSERNILKFLKNCAIFKIEIKNIDYIEPRIEEKKYRSPLDKKFCLSSEDIDSLTIKKDKMKLIKLLVNIYANYDKESLIDIIKSNHGKEASRAIFDLLNQKIIKLDDLSFENIKDLELIQKNLLFISDTKDEINYVIKISEGLTNSLKFIQQNCEEICKLLEKNASMLKWKDTNYLLSLSNPNIEDKIDDIYNLLSQIIVLTSKKNYKIINFDEISEGLVDLYRNKSLEEICKLDKIMALLKQKIKGETLIGFYNLIHKKGLHLIKNDKLTIEQIMNFMMAQDIFYYNPLYKNSDNRDPSIFNYIPITDKNKDYLDNIESIKKYRLWNLYEDSHYKMQDEFHKILLGQMIKIRDFKGLFDIFPKKYVKRDFTLLINGKFEELIFTVLEEKEENYNLIFEIFDTLLIYNDNNDLDLQYILNLIQSNLSYDFITKYYFYLLKNKDIDLIVSKLKNNIIGFFIEQTKHGIARAESLISLLSFSNDNKFTLYLLDQMDKMIATENDFYQKEESRNFLLFKLFFEKCRDLIKNKEISQGKYLMESILLKSKVLKNLDDNKIKFDIANNLIDENDSFYQKIFVLADQNKDQAKKIYDKLKESLKMCHNKFEKFGGIQEFYNTFYNTSKRQIINLIKEKLNELKQANINEIINLNEKDFIKNDKFDYEQSIEEAKNIKYKNSIFFMAIYRKKHDNEIIEKSEDDIFNESINNYKDTITRIINQKESLEPFFGINNIQEIMSAIQNPNNNLNDEIKFIEIEFADLGKENYIKNELLNDLINFSIKDKTIKLLNGIIYFIEAYKKIKEIEITDFLNNLKAMYESITSDEVNGEEIKKAIDLLKKYDYDIKNETSIIKFYQLLLGKEEAILFIKTIKDSNLEIRNLNEFIDESDNSQLQTTDIDNLIDVYTFFKKLMDNQQVKSDEDLLKIFRKEFDTDQDIVIKLQGYLNTYGEIIQLFQSYDENPEMTIQKIDKLLKESSVDIYKDNNLDIFIYKIKYKNQNNQIIETGINELEELRNKIYMSSTNTNALNNVGDQKDDNNKAIKEKLTNEFVNLMDNIKQLTKTLNILQKSGYPNVINLSLKIKNSKAYEENDENEENIVRRDLQEIIDYYNETNSKFEESIKKGYETCPFLRLFYGKQLIQLHEKATRRDTDISHLINSVTSNKIKNTQIDDFHYNYEMDSIQNINKYLEKLFKKNGVNIDEIYNYNKVKEDTGLSPGLYRKIKSGEYSDLINDILNIYINITGNTPMINTLLICNEDTTLEKIKSFLYRSVYCKWPVLFLISNMECLELKVTQEIIKILKDLYRAKNKKINSYLLFIYEKIDSSLAREIEKLIPERHLLNNAFLKPPDKKPEEFQKVELYSSKYSGYGKTTEIVYKVKNLDGEYHYLPIGGSFTRNYVIKNLDNLHLDLEKGNSTYLHLDLSDTDNDDLMNEILFKLIILRYLDSNEKIFYLGNDIHIIIEIPKGFIEFDKKYKLLGLFKKIHIDKLNPLRLEENIHYIKDSPISIVAEVLELYDNGQIGTRNIDLNAPISKSAKQCEDIINKHFTVENQSYYQKMNFIKILSVQFRKFTDSIYFNYDIANMDQKGPIIKKARIAVIKNFIDLTKVFTRSPFDSVLLKQQKQTIELFGKYDENQAIEDGVLALANDKQEIFSFEQIKPSLVFFNQDGQSLSIISNNNKNDQEYQNLKALWNSQNLNQNNWEELVDYKNMKHEAFLEQIKKLFSLDKMSIDELKKLCEKLGNYIFVSDNFIKMVRILLNIEAKIPVILMGETGVGKTKLLEMLTTLYGKGTLRMKRLQIHAGTTDLKIIQFIEDVIKQVKEEKAENEITWIFFDEINTCNSLGLITEIMCNHTYLGKKLDDNFVFLGACNPYRILTKKMRESGLVYYNMKEANKLNNLVYTVNPLPHALLNFVFDFASLQPKDEVKYITNTIISILTRIKRDGIINNINENDLNKLTNEIIDCIVICHDFIREKYDKSSVSMREIRRFGIFFEYFINYFRKYDSTYRKMKSSLNITLYLCYYLRLNDKEYRKELANQLNKFYEGSSFLRVPESEIKKITREMTIEKGTGIALNRALRENLFTCFVCIDNNVPLIIVGKPGTGKSLSFQILYNTLKGEYSDSPMFRDKGKLYRYYYQGSETSTAEGIEQVFAKAYKAQLKNKGKQIITLVFFDEMGLAERSSNNPLKVIHYLLERDSKESVPFLGISNWKLDAAKINRALSLTITDYDIEDLEETANSIAEALNIELADKYKDFFGTLARTYNKYIDFNQNTIKENKDFHGNRDFYNLIKTAMRELMAKRKELIKNERRILTEVGILCLNRNFGGLENSSSKIKEIFKNEYGHKYDEEVDLEGSFSVLDAIKKNILDPNSRYLMLISEGNDGSDIVKYLLNSIGKKFIELVGSKYKKDLKSGNYSEEILNKVKYIMETDNVLILRDLDMIYPSLYDLFNQNFTLMGDKKFARIAFEYAKISSEVNKDFHAIVIVNKNQIQNLKLDPPFLNRFEKHIVNFKMLLEDKDIEIAKKINDFIEIISSFNNEKNLKIDLGKLLINCKQHNIEGLIFKIKNDQIKNKNEDLLNDEQNYETFMIKEVFKKIVPTFCQDIMASMISCKLDQKYKPLTDLVIEIYKESQYNNFESFFKNMQSKKNIIYTFSKDTKSLFEKENILENKFGSFSKKNAFIENIQTIKEEKELITNLNNITNKDQIKIIVLSFSELHFNQINSTYYVISNFQKDNPKLNDKIILFIVHKKRQSKGGKKKKLESDFISFINDDFYQIYIDNLEGKENSDVFQIMQKKNEELAKEYIDNSNFIENKIFNVLNYMKYTILYETESLNSKNYTTKFSEKIINNEKIKELIKKNLKMQGKTIKGIIKDAFTTDISEVNDVDFFEVINSKLSTYFCKYFLNIIFYGFKENVLNQILNTSHFDLIMQNDYFNNLINSHFENIKYKFNPPIKMNVNANKITIYNGLEIPKSRFYLEKLINYINEEIGVRYIENEQLLRRIYKKEEKIDEATKAYYKEFDRLEENTKTEINKYEFYKIIYTQNNEDLKNLLLDEYLKYFIIKYLEKKEVDYKVTEKILNFFKLIIKVKLSDNHNEKYTFKNTLEEFIKIVLFAQGYKEDIKNLFDTFIEVQKYCENILESMTNLINEEKMKYEISERIQRYTKIVNINFFNIVESLLRGILLYSIELIKKDKVKFFEFFYSFTSVEANLQKLNKKFYLYSKEIFNIRTIIKIEEEYKYNHEEFEKNYEKIMNNLLQQSLLLYDDNYNNLYQTILDLNKIIDQTFKVMTEEYSNLLFYLFRQQYRNIYNEEIRIKLIENFFQNKLLIKKSKIFLFETLKDLKPEVYNEKNKKKEGPDALIKNFMNLTDNDKLAKYANLIKIFNNIKSEEFNEILLFFLEGQCQSYFSAILKKNKNEFTEKCCEQLLLKVSLEYLKKAIQYLYEHKNNSDNNLLKLYAIAYIKTYCEYYVEINYNHFDKCNFDEINKLLDDKDENNELIRKMRNIYIWRLYNKKFENFDQFKNYEFPKKNIPIYKELAEKLKLEEGQKNYIFKESLISKKYSQYYKKLLPAMEGFLMQPENNIELDFKEVNDNFDSFYCMLVNKLLSYLFSNDKNHFINKLKNIYELSNDKINLGEEGKILYKYLLNENLYQNEIVKKISDDPLKQDEYEILLYSFRFILNTQMNNKKNFYNDLLKKNASKFITNNYIPGGFPLINEFIKSYNDLLEKLPKKENIGYYICKDCGFLYEVPPCTFPMSKEKCPNNHIIGGENHICSKLDIRVFLDKKQDDDFKINWNYNNLKSWHDSFLHKTLEEFKKEYIDKFLLQKNKGINRDCRYIDFEKNSPVRELNIVSYRLLNFILYSYLLGAFILNNLSKEEIMPYLVENLFPHTLFGIIKKGWELLDNSLKQIGINNIQTFMNMIFDKVIDLMNNLESSNTVDKFNAFEKAINDYIVGIISNKDTIESLNKEYQKLNNDLLSFDPQSMKEIIQANFDPSIYDQNVYPDIQYYSISNNQNFNTFIDKFNSSEENKKTYALINILINKEAELTKDAINMKSLVNINNLVNLLLNIYSFKISREEGKKKILNDELTYIKDTYNETNPIKIDTEKDLINNYIDPFIKSWDVIKSKSIQYKCRILRELNKGEKPLDMKIENALCYFLVDDGDKDGGMFLASAYQHLIEWQNLFINEIISKNSMKGILNSYVSQLEQEINIEEATKDEIINIDENTYKEFYNLISASSMRNIFTQDHKINYKNYNDIKYNYEFIEEELGKLILPGLKKFKTEKIKFVTYLFEGFRGGNSTVLVDYNTKYIQRELTEEEKGAIKDLLKANNNSKFYNDVFASLQILMNEIIKENYDQNYLIYKIIESLPNYIILNNELVKLFKNKYEFNPEEKIFTINTLVSIFEYFEERCWKEIQKNILIDYKLELSEDTKKFVLDYFEKLPKDKIINKEIFTTALRRLISRSLAGSRQEIDIKSDSPLKLYMAREDLWKKDIVDNMLFDGEIYEICKDDIFIGNCWNLYNILEGDNIMNMKLNKELDNDKNIDNPVGKKKKDDEDNPNDVIEPEEEGEESEEEERPDL